MHAGKAGEYGAQPRSAERDPVTDRLDRLLTDPAFRVRTFDRTAWIDPYTGKLLPVPANWEPPVRTYLHDTRPWRSVAHPKPLHELNRIRWQHYLAAHIGHDRRLRLFDHNRRWLNPLTGATTIVSLPRNSALSTPIIADMAEELASDPDACPQRLLSYEEMIRHQRGITKAPGRHDDGIGTGPLPSPQGDPGRHATPPAIVFADYDTLVAPTRQAADDPTEHEAARGPDESAARLAAMRCDLPGYEAAIFNCDRAGGAAATVEIFPASSNRHLLAAARGIIGGNDDEGSAWHRLLVAASDADPSDLPGLITSAAPPVAPILLALLDPVSGTLACAGTGAVCAAMADPGATDLLRRYPTAIDDTTAGPTLVLWDIAPGTAILLSPRPGPDWPLLATLVAHLDQPFADTLDAIAARTDTALLLRRRTPR